MRFGNLFLSTWARQVNSWVVVPRIVEIIDIGTDYWFLSFAAIITDHVSPETGRWDVKTSLIRTKEFRLVIVTLWYYYYCCYSTRRTLVIRRRSFSVLLHIILLLLLSFYFFFFCFSKAEIILGASAIECLYRCECMPLRVIPPVYSANSDRPGIPGDSFVCFSSYIRSLRWFLAHSFFAHRPFVPH